MPKEMMNRFILYLSKSAYNKHAENLRKLLTPRRGIMLDVGCGRADPFWRNGRNQTIGIDINKNSLKIAKEKMDDAILADLNYAIPLKSGSIDIVYSDQLIEHLIDTDVFAEEISRIVRNEGFAIIGTENLASWHNIFALLLGSQPSSGPYISSRFKIGFHPIWRELDKAYTCYTGHNKVFTFKALEEFLLLHGFEIEKALTAGYYPFPPILSSLLVKIDATHAHFMVFRVRKRVTG